MLIPSKPATFTTHYSLQKGDGGVRVRPFVACRCDERHDTTALLTALSLSLPFPSPFDPNEHRNIIATATTTFIGEGKGRERTSRLLFREADARREHSLLGKIISRESREEFSGKEMGDHLSEF